MIDILKTINHHYADVLSCTISSITAIITIIYVAFTYKQMKAAKESVNIMRDGMKQEKQPCISLQIKRVFSGKCMSNGRRQMPVEFEIENIGDSPAISVYCISNLKLQNITNKKGSNIVNMFSGPEYFPFLKKGKSETSHIHYENNQIDYLFEDLTIMMNKNWRRIKENPTIHHYPGTEIQIRVFYKNMNEQWFETFLSQEVAWAYDEITKKETKYDLNEFTFPPRVLKDENSFTLQLVSESLSPLQIHMVKEEYVKEKLDEYKDRWPELFREV